VALWRLDSDLADEYIRIPAGDNLTLPGDHVAWQLGRSGLPGAFELGLSFVPPLNADANQRVYDDDLRATGATLLSVAAGSDAQRALAAGRIRSRLVGGPLGGEDDYYVRGAYECALLALGDGKQLRRVLTLLETGHLSQRRAITALTLAGSLAGFDWLLWNPQVEDADILLLLADERLGDVLADCLPSLPRLDEAAGVDLTGWQLRILRNAYAIQHATLRPAPFWRAQTK